MSLKIEHEEDLDLISYEELTDLEQEDLNGYDGQEESSFFRYRGNVYDINDFMRISENAPEGMKGFNGYASDSFFSGVLIKLNNDGEGLTAALYFS